MQRSSARTAHRSRVEREAQPLSIAVGVFGPLVVIVAAGILVIQLEVAQHGAVMDLNSRVVRIGSFEWLPYIVRAGFVLLGLAAALVYRRVLRTNAMKVLALTALILITVAALYAFRPLPNDGDSHSLVIFGVFYGASSPFTLALIAAVIADIIFGRKKTRQCGRWAKLAVLDCGEDGIVKIIRGAKPVSVVVRGGLVLLGCLGVWMATRLQAEQDRPSLIVF